TRPLHAFAAATERLMSSSEVGQSTPMPRCAVSMASATPRPSAQRCSRNAMVLSQSIAQSSHGSLSALESATTWAAANATRLSFDFCRSGKCFGSDNWNISSERSARGNLITRVCKDLSMRFIAISLQRRDVDPAPFFPALGRALHQLQPFRAFAQRVFVWRVFGDVADEHLPLHLEAVVEGREVGHRLP